MKLRSSPVLTYISTGNFEPPILVFDWLIFMVGNIHVFFKFWKNLIFMIGNLIPHHKSKLKLQKNKFYDEKQT